MYGHLNEMKIDVSDMTEVIATFRKAVKEFGLMVERFDSSVAALIQHEGGKHEHSNDTESGIPYTERNAPSEVPTERHTTSDGESGTVFSLSGRKGQVHVGSDDAAS
jgi:hypothetical protein